MRAFLLFSKYYAMMPNPKEKAEKLKLILGPTIPSVQKAKKLKS